MLYTNEYFTFTKPELQALASHASRDEARANLAVVNFNFTKLRAWSTDGHRLMYVGPEDHPENYDPSEVRFSISLDHLNAAIKLAKARDTIKIAHAGDTVKITVLFAGHQEIDVFEGPDAPITPPPVSQVFPRRDRSPDLTGAGIGLNCAYLGDVAKLGKIGDGYAVRLRFGGDLDPVVIERDVMDEGDGNGKVTRSACTWRLLIMPMRL